MPSVTSSMFGWASSVSLSSAAPWATASHMAVWPLVTPSISSIASVASALSLVGSWYTFTVFENPTIDTVASGARSFIMFFMPTLARRWRRCRASSRMIDHQDDGAPAPGLGDVPGGDLRGVSADRSREIAACCPDERHLQLRDPRPMRRMYSCRSPTPAPRGEHRRAPATSTARSSRRAASGREERRRWSWR